MYTNSSENSDTQSSLLITPSNTGGRVDGEPQWRSNPPAPTWAAVPWRAIIATIGLVLATGIILVVMYLASRVIIWTLIAGFCAVVLLPPVRWIQRRFGIRRGAAIALVVVVAALILISIVAVFILPVRRQLFDIATDLPGNVQKTARGEGQFGRLATKLGVQRLIQDNQASLVKGANSIQNSLPSYVGSALQSVLELITIAVITTIMLGQSELIGRASIRLVPIRHRTTVAATGKDAASAISGYMTGNLIISACAGLFAFLVLTILGVPGAIILALWVAFADLIPLVGATLGAIVAVIAALFVSPSAGITTLILFVLYQLFENSVLQTVIMSRKVRVSPLIVLLSVLAGVELFGFTGALLAVPVAGASSVVGKELWHHRPTAPDELLIVTNNDGPKTDTNPPKLRFLDRARRRLHRHSTVDKPSLK